MLYDESKELCGQADVLAWDWKTKEIIVMDFKTNKRIVRGNPFNQYMLAPYEKLADTNYIHYSIQLDTYAKMLSNWGLPVSKKKYLIHFSPETKKIAWDLIRCEEI